jgi:hypothetical protein
MVEVGLAGSEAIVEESVEAGSDSIYEERRCGQASVFDSGTV